MNWPPDVCAFCPKTNQSVKNVNAHSPIKPLPVLAKWIPALGWLRTYDKSWLRGDLLASITLAAYLLPAALGDASLARLNPEAGLYACLAGGLVFWLFCS